MSKIIKHSFSIPNLAMKDGELVEDKPTIITCTFTLLFKGFGLFEEIGAQLRFVSREGAGKNTDYAPVLEITTKYVPPVIIPDEDENDTPAVITPINNHTVSQVPSSIYDKTVNTTGTKTVKPKKVVIKSIKKKGRNSVKITWKKQKNISGYQIRYAANAKFKKAKVKKVSSKKTSVIVKKLSSGKMYRFRIRSFVKSDGKKIYGKYSNVKKYKL